MSASEGTQCAAPSRDHKRKLSNLRRDSKSGSDWETALAERRRWHFKEEPTTVSHVSLPVEISTSRRASSSQGGMAEVPLSISFVIRMALLLIVTAI